MNELEVQSLVKYYGDNLVVDHISFHVDDGEFFVLLGPSGGGKTTILRLLCGLEQPDEGRVIIHKRDVTSLAPRQRNLGMVFQDYGIYPTMDVYGNIAYGLEVRNMPKAEIEKRVKQAAEMLGLSKYLRKSAIDLSGGEKQRIALARALVKDADIYLYDEPLANLDPKLRLQARRDILSVHRAKQRPSLYVTHDQAEAFVMADRIAVIAKGRLQQIGTPDEILREPANIFMARFIGTPAMNIIPGELLRNGEQFLVRNEDLTISLPSKWRPSLKQYQQSQVMLGIRPDALIPEWQFQHLERMPQTILNATVVDIVSLIGESIVSLQLNKDTQVQALFEENDVNAFSSGDVIKIGIETDTLCLFDPQTEQALKVG